MQESKLYLVFEFLSMDLKKYLDSIPSGQYMDPMLVKVRIMFAYVYILLDVRCIYTELFGIIFICVHLNLIIISCVFSVELPVSDPGGDSVLPLSQSSASWSETPEPVDR